MPRSSLCFFLCVLCASVVRSFWTILAEHLVDHRAPVDGDDLVTVVVAKRQLVLIDAEGLQDRGVQVARRDRALDGAVADGVGGADDLTALDAAAGQPHRVAGRGMVAA